MTIKKGKWVDIGKKNPLATVTVKDTTAVTTYVEGYRLRPESASWLIKVLPGSAIVDAASLKVTAAYSAATGTVISGSTLTEVRAYLVFWTVSTKRTVHR